MLFLQKRIDWFIGVVPSSLPVIFLYSEILKMNKVIKNMHPYTYFIHPLYFNEKRILKKMQYLELDVKLVNNETIIIKKEKKVSNWLKGTKAVSKYRNAFASQNSWIQRLSEMN